MPNTKGAAKAMRQSVRRNEINSKVKDLVKRNVKEVRRLIKTGEKDKAAELMKKAMSALDKAAKKNVIHKNTASRKKSRLAKALAK
jgi:small subunit ribosomal protein S20